MISEFKRIARINKKIMLSGRGKNLGTVYKNPRMSNAHSMILFLFVVSSNYSGVLSQNDSHPFLVNMASDGTF